MQSLQYANVEQLNQVKYFIAGLIITIVILGIFLNYKYKIKK